MKRTSRLSSKGQVTIPREIRAGLHLEAGDLVAYDLEEGSGHAAVLCSSLGWPVHLAPDGHELGQVFAIRPEVKRGWAARV